MPTGPPATTRTATAPPSAGSTTFRKAVTSRSVEQPWTHRHVTHNRCYQNFARFKDVVRTFLGKEMPRNCNVFCETVTDTFGIISLKDFPFPA